MEVTDNKCRACESQVNLCDLFGTDNLSIKFIECTSLMVDANDQLPHHICKECMNELNIAYIFRRKCEITQHKLLKCLENKFNVKIEDFNHVNVDEENYLSDKNSIDDEFEEIDEICSYNLVNKLLKNETTINESNEAIAIDETNAPIYEDIKHTEILTKNSKSKKSFKCETCGLQNENNSAYNAHIKIHGTERFQCKYCQKWFPVRSRLLQHEVYHTGLKKFICDLCGKQYLDQPTLTRHINAFHNKLKPFKCDKCDKSFSRKVFLKQHFIVHIVDLKHECKICHKKFKVEKYLSEHMERHKPIDERKRIFICKYCGKKSSDAAHHHIHERTHTGERSFQCTVCLEYFPTQARLKSHILLHTGEKPYKCTVCSKKFRLSASLSSHRFVHTGEKPHKCNICDVTFAQIKNLKRHKIVHQGEKSFLCTVCDKAFAIESSLNAHMRLHTGDTPYHCEICEKKFCYLNGLRRHQLNHIKKEKPI